MVGSTYLGLGVFRLDSKVHSQSVVEILATYGSAGAGIGCADGV